jgi:hypothetical protein
MGMAADHSCYDPETIKLLHDALDAAWDLLPEPRRAATTKGAMAARLLNAAARGERDFIRLRAAAVLQEVHG